MRAKNADRGENCLRAVDFFVFMLYFHVLTISPMRYAVLKMPNTSKKLLQCYYYIKNTLLYAMLCKTSRKGRNKMQFSAQKQGVPH